MPESFENKFAELASLSFKTEPEYAICMVEFMTKSCEIVMVTYCIGQVCGLIRHGLESCTAQIEMGWSYR